MSIQIGIIGGSGLYDMPELTDREERTIHTPFGEPSAPFVTATLRGRRVAFLVLALLAYAYIVGVALTRNPLL